MFPLPMNFSDPPTPLIFYFESGRTALLIMNVELYDPYRLVDIMDLRLDPVSRRITLKRDCGFLLFDRDVWVDAGCGVIIC